MENIAAIKDPVLDPIIASFPFPLMNNLWPCVTAGKLVISAVSPNADAIILP